MSDTSDDHVHGSYNSDDTHENLELTPTPAKKALLTDYDKTEIEELRQLLIEGSKNKQLMRTCQVTKELARHFYSESLKAKSYGKTNFHLDSISCPQIGFEKLRTESRVSFQTLTLKLQFDSNRIVFNYQELKKSVLKQNYSIHLHDILGLKTEENSIIIDARKLCRSERHAKQNSSMLSEDKLRWTEEVEVLPSNTDSCYVRVSGDLHDHVADAELLRKALEGYSVTNTILARGLSDKYDVNIISNVSVRDLRDYFPVVCDPALVQAGLLAAKSITEEYLGCGSGLKVQDFVGRIAALQSTFEMQF